jgi:hypothetical protein
VTRVRSLSLDPGSWPRRDVVSPGRRNLTPDG